MRRRTRARGFAAGIVWVDPGARQKCPARRASPTSPGITIMPAGMGMGIAMGAAPMPGIAPVADVVCVVSIRIPLIAPDALSVGRVVAP